MLGVFEAVIGDRLCVPDWMRYFDPLGAFNRSL